MAVLAPMPSASATTATIVKPGAVIRRRTAWRRSCRKPRMAPVNPANGVPAARSTRTEPERERERESEWPFPTVHVHVHVHVHVPGTPCPLAGSFRPRTGRIRGSRARMLRHVRASVQMPAARPAISLGLTAATVTVPPLVIGELTGRPGLLWMSLGGWLCALADPGGPYPLRAAAMAAYLVFGTLATILGTATYRAWASVLVLFVFGACTSLARGLGDAAATVGAIVLIMLCIAVGSPAPAGALTRGALVGAGSLLAIALALGLWPVHPYRPARPAVADCYRALADLVDALGRLPIGSLAAREAAAAQAARIAPPRVRAALETARAALAAVRRGRAADTQRGEILLVLFESADLILGSLSAAIDPLAASPGIDPSFLRPLADSFRGIALATVGRGDEAPRAPRLDEPIGHPELHALLEPVMITATFAAEMADALRTGKHAQPTPAPLPDAPTRLPLRDQLALGSPLVRHAARMAFGLAAAGVLGQILHLSRGYWMTVTVVIVLQPDLGSTVRRALDRVAGTVLGAVSAAVVAPLVHRPFVFGALLFPLSVLAVALRPINYALYSAFVTLVFLLISEAFSGDWHLAGVRIGTTLLGGAGALVFGFLFLPPPSGGRFPSFSGSSSGRLTRPSGSRRRSRRCSRRCGSTFPGPRKARKAS